MKLLRVIKKSKLLNVKEPCSFASVKLAKEQSSLDVRKYLISQRTINGWNKLSTNCVHTGSVNMVNNII